MEVLEALKGGKFLDRLVFGGGTMLRLCYGLNRYSSDLDFWFLKGTGAAAYVKKLKVYLADRYEMTDAQVKHFTVLFELRSRAHPKRLKIEIRKEPAAGHFEDRIAYSPYDTRQVIVRVFSLEDMIQRKIAAALDRKDIRDFFDIEYIARKGEGLNITRETMASLDRMLHEFKPKDYKVTLGSVLEPAMREYYVKNGFAYLAEKLAREMQ